MRNCSRLQLLCFALLRSSPTESPSLLSHAVETNTSPSKYTKIHLGGDGGTRTRVQHAFASKELRLSFAEANSMADKEGFEPPDPFESTG